MVHAVKIEPAYFCDYKFEKNCLKSGKTIDRIRLGTFWR